MDISHELAKEYVLKTFDFSNGTIESFTNEYIETCEKISSIRQNHSRAVQRERHNQFKGNK